MIFGESRCLIVKSIIVALKAASCIGSTGPFDLRACHFFLCQSQIPVRVINTKKKIPPNMMPNISPFRFDGGECDVDAVDGDVSRLEISIVLRLREVVADGHCDEIMVVATTICEVLVNGHSKETVTFEIASRDAAVRAHCNAMFIADAWVIISARACAIKSKSLRYGRKIK